MNLWVRARALPLKSLLLAATLVSVTACASRSEPPPASAAKVASEMTGPVLISGKLPEYTQEAFQQRLEGPVAAKCTITETGEVTQCQILQSLPLMDQAVLNALARWRCKPALRDGKPVTVEHVFRLRLMLSPPNAVPFDKGLMTRPQLISGPNPAYTKEALANRVQGLFIAKCIINKVGEVKSCFVVKSLPYMDDKLLDTLMKRRYTPSLLNGEPVNVSYIFNVKMVLPHR